MVKKMIREYHTETDMEVLREYLPDWYEKAHRKLPWRESGAAYDIWLSEIMCQQTRINAVLSYYERFKKALPELSSLASVEDETLMKLWEGLGYYSRARNLKQAARVIVDEYEGKIPASYESLRKLPGIGPYTAGAIASIAFGEAVPAVDGNVLRICARIFGNYEDISKDETKRSLEEALRKLLSEQRVDPGILNQAMMELGALVCVPNGAPHCEECPMRQSCFAYVQDQIDSLPVKQPKKKRRIEKYTVLMIRNGDEILLQKRSKGRLLAGLWGLPMLEGDASIESMKKTVRKLGFEPMNLKVSKTAKHIFTHIEWHMSSYLIKVAEREIQNNSMSDDCVLATPAELRERYPLPSAFSAFLEELKAIGKDER